MTSFTTCSRHRRVKRKATSGVRVTESRVAWQELRCSFLKPRLEHSYLSETADVDLTDFDPTNVRMRIHRQTYEVDFRRSDGEEMIARKIKVLDYLDKTAYLRFIYVYLDSQDSARRFAAAITDAMYLCGGNPRPLVYCQLK
jgi:hypothetical protein